jgi:hypothetical protein
MFAPFFSWLGAALAVAGHKYLVFDVEGLSSITDSWQIAINRALQAHISLRHRGYRAAAALGGEGNSVSLLQRAN